LHNTTLTCTAAITADTATPATITLRPAATATAGSAATAGAAAAAAAAAAATTATARATRCGCDGGGCYNECTCPLLPRSLLSRRPASLCTLPRPGERLNGAHVLCVPPDSPARPGACTARRRRPTAATTRLGLEPETPQLRCFVGWAGWKTKSTRYTQVDRAAASAAAPTAFWSSCCTTRVALVSFWPHTRGSRLFWPLRRPVDETSVWNPLVRGEEHG
jgi:hypothetical protein